MSLFSHEHIILKVRRHPITFLMQIIIFLGAKKNGGVINYLVDK
jgi:hypothetical protein